MGMYTQLKLKARLRKDTPEEVMNILLVMLNGADKDYQPNLEHPLFKTQRWHWMFGHDSAYFSDDADSKMLPDEDGNERVLSLQFDMKNYDNEIGKLLHFLMPYLDEPNGALLGHYWYEERESATPVYAGMTEHPVWSGKGDW